MARPIELTSDVARRLADAFKEGLSIKSACALVGIAPDTYRLWMKAGRAGDQRFTAFSALMEKSRAKPELEAYQGLRQAFVRGDNSDPNWKADWKAAAKYLDLKDPNRWKRDKKTETIAIDFKAIMDNASPPEQE